MKDFFILSLILSFIYFISYFSGLPWIEFFELNTMDSMYYLRGEKKIEPNVVVVGIDEKTLSYFESAGDYWPWSREKFARVVYNLFSSGAEVVLIDVSFTNPSEEDPKGDRFFAAVLAKYKRVVIGTYLINKKETYDDYGENIKRILSENLGYLRYVYKMKNFEELRYLMPIEVYKVRPPIKLFSDVAPSASFEVAFVDIDGTIRAVPLFLKEKWAIEHGKTSGFLAHMDVLGVALFFGQDPYHPELFVDFKRRVVEIPYDGKTHEIHFDSRGLFNIYYYGKGENIFKTVSFVDVYNSKPGGFSDIFKDKIVIIGYTATAKGLYDLRITPFSRNEPGVYIHANAVENMLRGEYVARLSFFKKLLFIIVLLIVASLLLSFEKIRWNFLVFLLPVIGYMIGYHSFIQNGLYLDVFYPIFSSTLLGVYGVGKKLYLESKERKKFREFLYRYLDESIADQLVKSGTDFIKNEKKKVVILFSDIKGFTKMSENMDPEEIVNFLNVYLDRMSAVIKKHGGMIDKFIGDAIMAVFGVPFERDDDVERAIKCAVEMKRELVSLREELNLNIDCGIGMHYGEVVVGNIGASFRWDYTCIGDTVNTASRIESLTRKTNSDILISETMYDIVRNRDIGYDFAYVGEFSVKGKSEPVKVYKVEY